MGLTGALLRFGFRCPRPLIVTVPGHTSTRLAVESELRRRGGQPAVSPADADTLLTCGPVTGAYAEAVERAWQQLARPRARAEVDGPDGAGAALDRALAHLQDLSRDKGRDDPSTPALRHHLAAQHRSEEDDDMDMMPAGLPMAGTGPDRDGLQLDQLHVQLGPVLAHWPAGLALVLTVQGDVVQEAESATFGLDGRGPEPGPFWDAAAAADDGRSGAGRTNAGPAAGRRISAAHLDSVMRLLAVAGSAQAAAAAARLRDDLLAGADRDACAGALARLTRRVERSRTLRWLLRGVGTLTAGDARALGVAGPAARAGGDVHDRLRTWLGEAGRALRGDIPDGEGPRGPLGTVAPAAAQLDAVCTLAVGQDLAATRLIVASIDPDLDQLVGAPVGDWHG